MTVREVIASNRGKCVDVEIYRYNSIKKIIATDFIESVECEAETEVETWELMNELEYEQSVMSNTGEKADFEAWYDDKNAKVLVIIVK